jgi:hypothetical protein
MEKYTKKDIHECMGYIDRAESTIFLTLDSASRFWQMFLHNKLVLNIAFNISGLGQFEWLMLPLGLLGCQTSFL